MNEKDLPPCPSCQGTDVRLGRSDGNGRFVVRCASDHCLMQGPFMLTPEAAVSFWVGLASAARVASQINTIQAWLTTKPRKSLEVFQSMVGFSVMPRQHDAEGRDYYADGFDDDEPGAAGATLAEALVSLGLVLHQKAGNGD